MTNMLTAGDLHRLLHNGLLFAGKSDNLPMLNLVRLEFSAAQVISVSTDRYNMGLTLAHYAQDPEQFPGEPMILQIARPDAERLAKIAKTTARDGARFVDIGLNQDGRATFGFSTGEAITVDLVAEQFPKFRQLIPLEALAPPAEAYVGVNSARLVLFSKVIDPAKAAPVLTLQGEAKPVMITIGQQFIGLMMPVKGYSAFVRPAWADEQKAPEAEKAEVEAA